MKDFITVPLTRHAGYWIKSGTSFFGPASNKLLKPLDSALRRNDGRVLFVGLFSTGRVPGSSKHFTRYIKHKIKLTGQPWKSLILTILLALLSPSLCAADEIEKEKRWWEKRHQRTDIFYPHNAHQAVMEEGGDACLRCHPFNGNDIRDSERLQAINVIANEPLREICHSCHAVQPSAPWHCDLCHDQPQKIWPQDHNFNYILQHGEDSRLDESQCRECHLDLSFCSDCHFRRDSSMHRVHPLAYISAHGLEARIDAASCGRCHPVDYCSDCHRRQP